MRGAQRTWELGASGSAVLAGSLLSNFAYAWYMARVYFAA